MARTRAFDDLAAVRAARDLFWEKGYEAVSLVDLQKVTGLSRSSIYAAYGSKRELFERASLNYLVEVVDPLLAPMEAPGADRGAVRGFFLAMADVLRSPDTRFAKRGCFLINIVLELEVLDQRATDMVTQYRTRVNAALTNALTSIDDPAARAARAEVLTATQIGAMVTARLDPAAAAVVCETTAARLSED
jgi:AcrR family transcriptional regulator